MDPEAGSDSAESSSDPDAEVGSENQTPCERYGGADTVASVVADHIVPELIGDCRVSAMFTALPEPAQKHLVECHPICPTFMRTVRATADFGGVTKYDDPRWSNSVIRSNA